MERKEQQDSRVFEQDLLLRDEQARKEKGKEEEKKKKAEVLKAQEVPPLPSLSPLSSPLPSALCLSRLCSTRHMHLLLLAASPASAPSLLRA